MIITRNRYQTYFIIKSLILKINVSDITVYKYLKREVMKKNNYQKKRIFLYEH